MQNQTTQTHPLTQSLSTLYKAAGLNPPKIVVIADKIDDFIIDSHVLGLRPFSVQGERSTNEFSNLLKGLLLFVSVILSTIGLATATHEDYPSLWGGAFFLFIGFASAFLVFQHHLQIFLAHRAITKWLGFDPGRPVARQIANTIIAGTDCVFLHPTKVKTGLAFHDSFSFRRIAHRRDIIDQIIFSLPVIYKELPNYETTLPTRILQMYNLRNSSNSNTSNTNAVRALTHLQQNTNIIVPRENVALILLSEDTSYPANRRIPATQNEANNRKRASKRLRKIHQKHMRNGNVAPTNTTPAYYIYQYITNSRDEDLSELFDTIDGDNLIQTLRLDPSDKNTDGELYKIRRGNRDPFTFVRLLDTSTGTPSFLRVPPHLINVNEAKAWTFGMHMTTYTLAEET